MDKQEKENGKKKRGRKKKELISLVDKWNEQMNLIYEKTGIKGIYVIFFLIGAIIFVYFNIFENLITNLVGTVYPAFWTIKSIEKDDLSEQKNWLTYWAVFGFFILIDMFSPIIVKFIPFYLVMKILFLIWMFMPGTNGSKLFYEIVVKKILKKYETKIDVVVKNVGEVFQNEEGYNYERKQKRISNQNNNNDLNLNKVMKSSILLKKRDSNEEEENEENNNEQNKEKND